MWYSLLTMVMDLTHGTTQDVREDRTPKEYNNFSLQPQTELVSCDTDITSDHATCLRNKEDQPKGYPLQITLVLLFYFFW
jgi:hypothetical protein